MKTELEAQDIEAIAQRVVEILRPLVSGNGNGRQDEVFDKAGLAAYLKVSESTISKLVSQKGIPHWKIAPGRSGGVRFFKREIDKWILRRSIPDVLAQK